VLKLHLLCYGRVGLDLRLGYPEKLVAGRIYMEINQGEHVAVLGDNGQGKTTFLRTIAEDLAIKGGSFKWGHGIKIAYYAQHVFSSLRPDIEGIRVYAEPCTDFGFHSILSDKEIAKAKDQESADLEKKVAAGNKLDPRTSTRKQEAEAAAAAIVARQ
jgi:ABC-type uncharacterized transport system ATPase subunit